MPRGGARPGAGRKPGSKNKDRIALESALAETGIRDMRAALVAVIDDEKVDTNLRLFACQILSGALMSKVLSNG